MPETESKKPRIVKVVVDRALCIGAASCLAVAPDIFALDSENIAVVKSDAPVDEE
ncbi:MAG: ferredoxin, partial [Candidatus Komeilibacteria bacterium]|nr:ferredoxin [Candidatus Komeilibacteria bacterium]